MRVLLLLALGAASGAAAQEGAAPDCGGDAHSSAQVIENRPARRGPITAMPDTLCADVAPQPSSAPVELQVFPSIAPQVGSGGLDAPYGEQPRRRGRPFRHPYP